MFTYIPFRDQDDLLILDSTLPVDTYEQLFRVNRFTGSDRVGDSQAISIALENTFLGQGDTQLNFAVGKNYSFTYHKVCLSDNCAGDVQATEHWSPWQFKASWHNTAWDSRVIWAVDHALQHTNSAYFDLMYGANYSNE